MTITQIVQNQQQQRIGKISQKTPGETSCQSLWYTRYESK